MAGRMKIIGDRLLLEANGPEAECSECGERRQSTCDGRASFWLQVVLPAKVLIFSLHAVRSVQYKIFTRCTDKNYTQLEFLPDNTYCLIKVTNT